MGPNNLKSLCFINYHLMYDTQYATQYIGDHLKTKNHHMRLRNKVWQLKLRIPTDVQRHYTPRSSMFIEETLRTSDPVVARRLRDAKLASYTKLWSEMRLREFSGRNSVETAEQADEDSDLLDLREQTETASEYIGLLGDRIDSIAHRLAGKHGLHDIEDARDLAIKDGEGAELWRRLQLLRGDLTPLEPYCWEWFRTKGGKAHKTQIEYRRAIRILLEEFEFLEDVKHRKVKRFLVSLLANNAKATVGKYTTAFRGIWKYHGWPNSTDMWSIADLDSSVPAINVRAITDDEYLRLMRILRGTKRRKLYLAMRLAAYTGASRSGVCGLRLEGADTSRPSLFLPETKREWRTRRIPCHPAILDDAKEWCASPLAPTTVTNEFTDLKREAGLGRDTVYHSFRHSVVNKLENARVSSREIKRLVGHRIGNLTFDTYSAEGLGYEVLQDVVNKLEWPHLDWD